MNKTKEAVEKWTLRPSGCNPVLSYILQGGHIIGEVYGQADDPRVRLIAAAPALLAALRDLRDVAARVSRNINRQDEQPLMVDSLKFAAEKATVALKQAEGN